MRTNLNVKLGILAVATCVLLAGCVGHRGVQTAVVHPCDEALPDTHRMTDAIARAEVILQDCPERQEEIFLGLLEIGKRNPGVDNRSEILDLYKRLIEYEVINVREANAMLTRYFYTRFAAVDGVNERFSSLSDRALDRLSQAIDDELAMKRVGLQEVADVPEQYEKAQEYAERMRDILESTKIQWSHLRKESAP